MTETEVLALLVYVEQAWPNRPFDVEARLAVWSDALVDADPVQALTAVKRLAKTDPYPPSIADIHVTAAKIKHGDIPSWIECKALIEASSNGRGLPAGAHPIVREVLAVVGGPATLAALEPGQADWSIRNAHATIAERHATLVAEVGPALETGSNPEGRELVESVTSGMFPKP